MNELLSVVVPVYNGEKYISKCIQSIMAQTYQNLEIILVDDGSTDKSKDMCHRFVTADSRVRYFLKENGGQASARNYGMNCATGQYITFVDQDDWIDSNMYECLINNLQKYDVSISGCATMAEKSGGGQQVSQIRQSRLVDTEELALDVLYQNMPWGTVWNKVFKREVFEDVRFPEGMELEDYYVLLKIYTKINQVYFDSRAMYHYLIHGDSQSNRPFHEGKMTMLKVIDLIEQDYIEKKVSQKLVKGIKYYRFIIFVDVIWSIYHYFDRHGRKMKLKELHAKPMEIIKSAIDGCRISKNDIKRIIKIFIVYIS